MRVHLVKNEQVRADQLRVLKMGMVKWEKELRAAGKNMDVTLHYHDVNTVEIFPIIGNAYNAFEEAQELFGVKS